MEDKKDKLFEDFTKELFKLEPINFFGLAKLLCVEISLDGEEKLRDMKDVVADILNKFDGLSNGKKKEILKICKQTNKLDRGGNNGNRTKDGHKRKRKSK